MVGSSPTVRVCGQICHIWNVLKLVRHQRQMGNGSIPIDTFLVGWTSIYQLFWGSLGARVLTHPQMKRRDVPQALFRQNLASYWTAATNIWTIRMLLGCAPGHPESGPLCMLSLNGFHSQMMSDGQNFRESNGLKITSGLVCLGPRFRGWSGTGFRSDLLPWPEPRQMLDDAMTISPRATFFVVCRVAQPDNKHPQNGNQQIGQWWPFVNVYQLNCHIFATKSLSIRYYSPLSPFLDLGWPQFPWDPAQERRLGRLRGWHLVHALQDHQSGGAGASSRGHGQGESALWQVLEGRWDDGTPGIMGGVDGGDVYGQQIIP